MPRELIARAPGVAEFREYEIPELAPDQIRVQTKFAAAKHGTEMAFFKGYGLSRGQYDDEFKLFRKEGPVFKFPCPLGNTSVGTVVEVGSAVSKHSIGDTVFAYGPFREIHTWSESQARSLPESVPWQAACCLDPADFAVGAIRDGNVRLGDRVVVFGMGAIGICALQAARAAGAHFLVAVEPEASRRDLALELGADVALDPASVDVGMEVRYMTDKVGADVCIEYSGHYSALNQAIRAAAYKGTVVAGSFPGGYPAGLDFGAEAHFNRIQIVFSRSNSEPNPDFPNWDESRLIEVAWRLLTEGQINAEAIVQPVVEFAELAQEYPRIATDTANYLKLGAKFS
jgi:threonine dehydrogenase-like Zn-dependent dehydrogenase